MSTAASPKSGCYIARDHEDSTLIAVYRPTAGRHERVATGFTTRAAADRWIRFQQVGSQDGDAREATA